MGNANPRPLLLPQKLVLIREYLNASESVMQTMLVVKTNVGLALFDIPKASYVSEYENGVRRPSLLVGLAYSRLGKVSLESVVDDDVGVAEFFVNSLANSSLGLPSKDGQARDRNAQRRKGG